MEGTSLEFVLVATVVPRDLTVYPSLPRDGFLLEEVSCCFEAVGLEEGHVW